MAEIHALAGQKAAMPELAKLEGFNPCGSARRLKKGVVVTIFPDRGEKQLSTPLFDS